MPCKNKKIIFIISLCVYVLLNSLSRPAYSAQLPETPGQTTELRSVDPSIQALALFLSTYIQQPLWSHTRAPAVRDVLYLMPQNFAAKTKQELAVNFFYNEVHNMRITVGNLLQTNTIANEDEILNLFLDKVDNPEDRNAVLPLFKKVSIQERRVGFLARTAFKTGPFAIQIHLPLIIDERNCWLNGPRRTKLLRILDVKFSDIPIHEFYRLKAGLGDTRVTLGFDDLEVAHVRFNIGAQSIFPTSKLAYSARYETNVESIPNISDIDDLKDEMLKVGRNIRNYLLNPRFGNSGHFGLGMYSELKTSILNDRIDLWAKATYDMLFDANEDRLFFFKQTLSNGTLDQEIVNDQPYNYLKQFVFPSSFNVKVSPGNIFNGVLAASTVVGKTRWTCGYDFYGQQHEIIKHINNVHTTSDDLKVKEAESLKARQHKIFTEALYKNKLPVSLGFGGDATVASVNMGKDWTLYMKSSLLF